MFDFREFTHLPMLPLEISDYIDKFVKGQEEYERSKYYEDRALYKSEYAKYLDYHKTGPKYFRNCQNEEEDCEDDYVYPIPLMDDIKFNVPDYSAKWELELFD